MADHFNNIIGGFSFSDGTPAAHQTVYFRLNKGDFSITRDYQTNPIPVVLDAYGFIPQTKIVDGVEVPDPFMLWCNGTDGHTGSSWRVDEPDGETFWHFVNVYSELPVTVQQARAAGNPPLVRENTLSMIQEVVDSIVLSEVTQDFIESYVFTEIPTSPDGVNFETAENFIPATLEVFLNGLKQKLIEDFLTSGTRQIILNEQMEVGEDILVSYIRG